MSVQDDFQMEQYRSIRKEIEADIAEVRAIQRYAIIAIGAVWAWVALNPEKAPTYAEFLPLTFVVLGGVQSYAVLREMQHMGIFVAGYIEPIFCNIQGAPLVGWESWLRRTTMKQRASTQIWQAVANPLDTSAKLPKRPHNPVFTMQVWSLWSLLFLVVLLGGWMLHAHRGLHHEPVKTGTALPHS